MALSYIVMYKSNVCLSFYFHVEFGCQQGKEWK